MSPESTVWVTGAGGLIGAAAVDALRRLNPQSRILPVTRDQIDLTRTSSIQAAYQKDAPDAIVHCAAISRPPDCERDPDRARMVNVEATRILVALHGDRPFVFLSTDVVFDGQIGDYREDAPLNPLSLYAETKAQGEAIVSENPQSIVVRTSLNGGRSPTGDRGFNEQMRRAWAAGQTLKLFTDEYRTPIAAPATAEAIARLIMLKYRGVIHIAGGERLSRWRIGQILATRHPELNPQIEPSSLKDYTGPPRSPDCCLNIDRANRLLPQPLPGFSEWLRGCPTDAF